jgi:hypothetical protein
MITTGENCILNISTVIVIKMREEFKELMTMKFGLFILIISIRNIPLNIFSITIQKAILFITKAIYSLVQGMLFRNESNWIVAYGQKMSYKPRNSIVLNRKSNKELKNLEKETNNFQNILKKSDFLFKNRDCMFAKLISSIFENLNGTASTEVFKKKRKTEKALIAEDIPLPPNYKLTLSCYQIINDRVEDEVIEEGWRTIKQYDSWRKMYLEKAIKKKKHGHMIVSVKVRDKEIKRENEITIVDILDFDKSFTDRIMKGETDVELNESTQSSIGKFIE